LVPAITHPASISARRKRFFAAAEAQRIFKEATKDQVFLDEILVLQAYRLIDLGIMASDMLQKLFEHELTRDNPGGRDRRENGNYPFVLEATTTLAALGFFRRHYPTLPDGDPASTTVATRRP
jgi:hypothetical protein